MSDRSPPCMLAVETPGLRLFRPQIPASSRGEMLNIVVEGVNKFNNHSSNLVVNHSTYGEPFGYGRWLSGTTMNTMTPADAFISPAAAPIINGTTRTINIGADWIPAPVVQLSDMSGGGLTYSMIPNINLVSRKRPRDDHNNLLLPLPFPPPPAATSFLGEDISNLHDDAHRRQMEIHHLIALHTAAKLRREIEEEQRENNWRMIIRAAEESMVENLRAKQEEIEKIGKLNGKLEEKVRWLWAENQIWRGLAESNEATAIALRKKLEQVLAVAEKPEQVVAQDHDDPQSCCGSNYYIIQEEEGGEAEQVLQHHNTNEDYISKHPVSKEEHRGCGRRKTVVGCKSCGKEEASVVVLPCRHLCLCHACGRGPALHSCPVCLTTKNAILFINLSS